MIDPASDMEEFVVTCRSIEDLESLYNDIETAGGSDTIPDRAIPVYSRRQLSQNTHYMLTAEEAEILLKDDRVISIENVKFVEQSIKLHSYEQTGAFSKSSTQVSMDPTYRNWALLRCIEGIQRSGWGASSTYEPTGFVNYANTSQVQNATITIGPTGKNVDVIIMDGICGVPNHPEFAKNADGTGGSRYIQFDWYQLNTLTASLDDDASTLLSGSYSYAKESNTTNANHGAHVTGTVAGNTCGWARDANIYQLGPLGEQGISALIIWDYVRAFHKSKPINPETGRKNPTICNCSYGSTVTFPSTYFGPITEGTRRGVTVGDYTKDTALTSSQLNSVGMYNTTYLGQVQSSVPYYSTANAADITAALNDGIIIVAAAGNDSYFIDTTNGLDYNNDFIAKFSPTGNPPTGTAYLWYQHKGTVPCGVPGVICVGATDAIATERKGGYSNTGPRIDIFAPGTWIVSSIVTSTGDWGGSSAADSRNSSYYIGREVGTSMASPQVCGVLACLLELYPSMTPAQARSLIISYAKTGQLSDAGGTSPSWTSNAYSLQGAPNRYLYLPKERPASGEMYPKQNHMLRPTSGIMYPRRSVRIR